MALRIQKPTTNARRKLYVADFSELHQGKPYKKLVRGHAENAGRNNQGKITVRHRGAGNKRLYRLVDFVQDKYDIPGKVERLEYDPFRSARIALILYRDGERRYIPAQEGLSVGGPVLSSRKKVDLNPGNRMPLKHIPTGVTVSLLELLPGRGAKIARGAGNKATIAAKEGENVHIKMPSGEIRLFNKEVTASIGAIANADHINERKGKAGRMRWLRVRPTVKGKSMNPVDHPHGGGEGHSPIGLKHPKTPWGKPALGYKTRSRKKKSDRFIVKPRKGKSKRT
ncbi:MAG: 50S ribosomal protein L2 [bacterium]|nr:50S ribosomal protein L2 [bacterium]